MRGKDSDGDGHGDARCTLDAEADDCDDALETVYTGAAEICDGLDNDCDTSTDLDDGLELYGEGIDLPQLGGNPLIAWSTTSRSYGVAWEDVYSDAPHGQVRFSHVSLDGKVLDQPLLVSKNNYNYESNHVLALAWGDSEFAVVYYQVDGSDPGLYFQRIDAMRGLLGARVGLTQASVAEATIAQAVGGDWYVFWAESTRIWGAQISPTGIIQRTYMVSHDTGSHLTPVSARAEARVVLGYQDADTKTIFFKRFTDSVVVNDEAELSLPSEAATNPVVGASASEFGFGWSVDNGSTLRFRTLSSEVAVGCDAIDLHHPVTGALLTGIASHAGGWLVALVERISGSQLGYARMARVGPGCVARRGLLELDDERLERAERPRIAASDAGYAVVWARTVLYRKQARIRVFGPNLCDAPIMP
jgi:hypothetical protein